MTQFVTKGDAPLTPVQLEKRAQKYIKRSWSDQAREKSIRTSDGAFDTFMSAFSADHDVNIANNTFNWQLSEYRKATARLAQYVLADGRAEVREMQPTGEQVFNEETMEMEDVMHEVITVTAIEPVEATVTRLVYSDDIDADPKEETIENPLITTDVAERAAAQATVDATPQAVEDAA
jgi:hypothetical protein